MSSGKFKPVLKQSDPTDRVKYDASEGESSLLDAATGGSQGQRSEGIYEQTISLKEHPETSGWAERRQIVEEKEEASVQVLDGETKLQTWSGLQEKETGQTEAIAEQSREGLKESGLFETKLKEPSERHFTESKENVSGTVDMIHEDYDECLGVSRTFGLKHSVPKPRSIFPLFACMDSLILISDFVIQ